MSPDDIFQWNTTNSTGTPHEDHKDPEDTYTPYSERPETYIVPVVFFIIFIVGVLGNGTLVIIFFRHRAMRNVPNTYILSLALADLLVIVTCVPFTAQIYTVPTWPWGVALCKLSEMAKDISIGVSVFTLTALSAERYCAIVNPLRRFQIKPLTLLTAMLIWLVAIVLALPSAIISRLEVIPLKNSSTITICSPFPEPPYKRTYARYSVVAKALIYYIIPLCIITGFYVLMAQRLQASTREMPGELQGQSQAQTRARRHVARMVLAFVFLFFICFLPHHVFMLWFWLNPSAEDDFNDFWNTLRIVGFCLRYLYIDFMSYLNSCVNPVALCCVSGVFRQHFNRYLCCQRPRLLQRTVPSQGNCETSFNSTCRRHIQGTTLESQQVYRKNAILARQKTFESSVTSFDVGESTPALNKHHDGALKMAK